MSFGIILEGIVGSTAHGLAREGSDEDTLGVFSYDTNRFWSLHKVEPTIVSNDPDSQHHELEKFLSLAAKCNPTILELLWLGEWTEAEEEWGERLVQIRSAFLTEKYVMDAYMGYAEAQFRKLNNRDLRDFGAGGAKRAHKNARHMFRLLEQGQSLYTTGTYNIKVADPQWYFDLENWSMGEISDEFMLRFEQFVGTKSNLPSTPDWGEINTYLYDYRKAHIQ